MSDIRFIAIAEDRLRAMRAAGWDEHGNPWTHRRAEGWEPLRCCLRTAGEGDDIALICYTPWTRPSPWAEAGPVFVHFHHCDGYPTTGDFPAAFRRSRSMLNPFDHSGARVYDRIAFLDRQDDHEAAVRAIMTEPEVDFLHVRSAAAGCFHFEVRREE